MKNARIYSIIVYGCVKKQGEKRSVLFISKNKIKYYTKEMAKILKLITIALVIIMLILIVKYKPLYKVTINGESVGYINNKKAFETLVSEEILENKGESVAFVDLNSNVEYEYEFVDRDEEPNEEKIFETIKNNVKTTYQIFAITLDGENRGYTNTLEEAETVVNQIKKEYNKDLELNIGINKIYTESLDTQSIELATKSLEDKIDTKIKEKKSTVNGIVLAYKPVTGGSISSRYGVSSRIRSSDHTGLDVAASSGTDIVAAASGEVTFSGWKGSYGYLVIISHGNGVETWYGHCSKLYVSQGETVEGGETIALVGSTGNSTGPHLHLEVRINGTHVNPQNYLYN